MPFVHRVAFHSKAIYIGALSRETLSSGLLTNVDKIRFKSCTNWCYSNALSAGFEIPSTKMGRPSLSLLHNCIWTCGSTSPGIFPTRTHSGLVLSFFDFSPEVRLASASARGRSFNWFLALHISNKSGYR